MPGGSAKRPGGIARPRPGGQCQTKQLAASLTWFLHYSGSLLLVGAVQVSPVRVEISLPSVEDTMGACTQTHMYARTHAWMHAHTDDCEECAVSSSL